MIVSVIFGTNAFVNHINEENVHRGHVFADKDFFKHQVHTSSNHSGAHTDSAWGFFWFILTGGLSKQIEHHLFPGFNHIHLYCMYPLQTWN